MVATLEKTPAVLGVGMHAGLSFADYALIDAVNWSTLKPYKVSAKNGHYFETKPDDSTDAKDFGAAFHTAILEPDVFTSMYVTMPRFEGDPRTNVYKAQKAAFIAENSGKAFLTADEYADLRAMQKSVRDDPAASAILYSSRGKNELTVLWDDPHTGRRCKGRIDRLAQLPIGALDPLAENPEQTAIVLADVKTTRNIELRKFRNDFVEYAYHGQFASYHDGLQRVRPMPLNVYSIAVQNKAPFDVVVYHVGDDELEHGRRLYRRLFDLREKSIKENHYPGISNGRVVPFFLPDYAHEGDIEDPIESDGDE